MKRGLLTWGLGLMLGVLLGACSSDNNTPPSDGGDGGGGGDAGVEAVITIENFTFVPDNLDVMPGETIRVINRDSAPHSVTSESTEGSFTPGAVNGVSFDTGSFNGEKTFTVPATAPSGTVVPYYCTVHKGGMRNTGHITVQ